MALTKYLKNLEKVRQEYEDVANSIPKPKITKWTLFKKHKLNAYKKKNRK